MNKIKQSRTKLNLQNRTKQSKAQHSRTEKNTTEQKEVYLQFDSPNLAQKEFLLLFLLLLLLLLNLTERSEFEYAP